MVDIGPTAVKRPPGEVIVPTLVFDDDQRQVFPKKSAVLHGYDAPLEYNVVAVNWFVAPVVIDVTPPVVTYEIDDNVGSWYVYVFDATALLAYPPAAAIAFTVVVVLNESAVVYTVDDVVGVDPSTV